MTANGGFRSFAQPQQVLTVPIRGLARVAQRQVAQVALARYRQRVRQKKETHEIRLLPCAWPRPCSITGLTLRT
ncbi:hypothetical protein [Rothia nasimurium]|uniref:hypothetical protein n=1 Tax=Rothia nasimurium TaxID=85336 RepID=UPI00142FBAC4|nr:hypothetical protein [Rothia nasimurium]MBF0808800.1 hypothetical protein [Rothia nasimurium]